MSQPESKGFQRVVSALENGERGDVGKQSEQK